VVVAVWFKYSTPVSIRPYIVMALCADAAGPQAANTPARPNRILFIIESR